MRKYYLTLRYFVYHKWHVFKAAHRLGETLLGIIHDWSKLLPDEFLPYAEHHYGQQRDEDGFWESQYRHQRRNKHHWQAWLISDGNGDVVPLPMPEKYIREMVADWVATGTLPGHKGPREFYERFGEEMILHPHTRRILEGILCGNG